MLQFLHIIWDMEDDPKGNVQHIAEHGLSLAYVETVLNHPYREGFSKSTGRPAVWGYTPENEYIIVIYERIDLDTIRVITAFEVPEP
jgi:uncharacterized DUF497 family protein